ncbi:MAG TPA: alpha/beta hydrolase, partial [Ktedonobacteraceae bacterium]|nr:alpha/beta hydrolase [Ktedonobacteraceae bacterium]
MRKVISKDGTPIAFDQSGVGPPVILVVGAFNDRATGAPLAAQLSEHFTVFNYDRRGRGASGDSTPYAIEREIEDLAALLDEAGGSSSVFGYSSGAILILKAAASGLALSRLALYEPPFLLDDGFPQRAQEISVRLTELVASGRRGDAVELFQMEMVGIPAEIVAQMRHAPFRPALENIAPTLIYEATIMGDISALAEQLPSIRIPTLVISGGISQAIMRSAAQTLADALPNAEHRSLEGQTHDIVPAVLAPVLE